MTDQPKAEIERKLDTPVDEAPLTFKMIQSIADTDMVPSGYRGNPHAIVAAILSGRELNLPPFEAMRSIDVIDGKPSLSAELIERRIREAGHRVKTVEATPDRVTLRGARMGDPGFDPEWDVEEATYTWEEASRVVVRWKMEKSKSNGKWYPVKDADGQKIPESYLTDKDNWRNYPTDMLYWRCLTRLARRLFPDAIGATRMTYTAEELSPNLADYTPPPRESSVLAESFDPETGEVFVDEDDEVIEAEIEAVNDDEAPPAESVEIEDAEIVADVEPTPETVDSEAHDGPIPAESAVAAPADDDPFVLDGSNPANAADQAAAEEPLDEPELLPGELDVAWANVYRYCAMENPLEGNMDAVRDRVRSLFSDMRTVSLWPDTAQGKDALHVALAQHFAAAHLSELRRDQLDEFVTRAFAGARKKVEDHGRQDALSV
jgi:hypothetical protein